MSKAKKGRKSIWTDELVEELLRLWEQELSAAEIARRLGHGLTRNAVIGKIHRLRAEGRAPARRETRNTAPRSDRTKKGPSRASAPGPVTAGTLALKQEAETTPQPVQEETRPTPRPVEQETGLVHDIQDLTSKSCRWPIGHPGEEGFSFCGRTAMDGLPYCEHHAAIAYQNLDQRRRATG